MKPQSHRHAFTLIELLVVIAIIAILAAILFPVFAAAREKGRQTVCASNLKQIGSALLMYQQDNDEAFPLFYDTPFFGGPGAIEHTWPGTLQPYSKSYDIWKCPTDPNANDQPMNQFGSYFVNTYLNGWCNHPEMNGCGHSLCDAIPPSLSAIPYPVTTVVLGEGGRLSTGYLTPPSMWCDIWSITINKLC
jgi:prepilin-type N-terminal cleavage/methylation domain-containing protein